MKHCHFSILYNELPFLKEKLPFLYKFFDQLIFFDLNVGEVPPHFSTDGSHEYIRDFPDPQGKITLIEKENLDNVLAFCGDGSVEKQKMFAVGSSYVFPDMDVFWCTDMDEFFHSRLISKVERILRERSEVNSIDLRHLMFWKSLSYTLSTPTSDYSTLYARICRHKPGNLYSHCAIHKQFPETFVIEDECYYHFAWVGDTRVRSKIKHYSRPPTGNPKHKKMYDQYLDTVWDRHRDMREIDIPEGELYGYPHMHPNYLNSKMGIKSFNKGDLPPYINPQRLLNSL